MSSALPDESFEVVHGVRHHVLAWDGPAERTIVLLHGWLDLAWSWQPLAERLAGRYRLVAFDFRGHGDTDRVAEGGYYHFPDYLRDLHALLPRLSPLPATLLGHSMGGTVASMYAGSFPDRISRLVVVDGFGVPSAAFEDAPARISRWLAGVEQVSRRAPRTFGDLDEAAQRLRAVNPRIPQDLALLLAEKGTRVRPDGRREWKHDPLHATRSPIPAYRDHYLAFMRAIACPTLLVRATESSMAGFPDIESRIEAVADRVETRLPCGHMVHHERPAELARAVEDFLTSR